MMYAMLIAAAVAAPQDWGAMVPRGQPSGKIVLRTLKALQPPPGLPPAPLAFNLNVSPPGAASYTVPMSFNALAGGWEGFAPANAKTPYGAPGGIYRIVPYERNQFGQHDNPASYALLITCNPPVGGAGYGGGHIRHNPGPGFSAGPTHPYNFLGQGSVTVGYAFTVTP